MKNALITLSVVAMFISNSAHAQATDPIQLDTLLAMQQMSYTEFHQSARRQGFVFIGKDEDSSKTWVTYRYEKETEVEGKTTAHTLVFNEGSSTSDLLYTTFDTDLGAAYTSRMLSRDFIVSECAFVEETTVCYVKNRFHVKFSRVPREGGVQYSFSIGE